MHKPNCTFEDFHTSLTNYNPYGKDTRLTINSTGIEYESNLTLYTDTKDDVSIVFNYCPMCGCLLNMGDPP